ncbi:atrial natriuretic peptide receptor 1 [Megalops cyprinoides]|uniref:atrial natriuretic peptide receptor 1 n=1 Tax=Megalops cyprinoides TaxID=118141 RepID=UPI001863C9B9|nr:atrial natriuretic peptide receptor 1 [Megalops cyprinoides]
MELSLTIDGILMEAITGALVLEALMLLLPQGRGATLTLLISMPNASMPFSVGRIGAGALIAIDAVNRSPDLLPGHRLEYEYVDDECSAVTGAGKIVTLQHRRNYSAFIGPCCSQVCSQVARLAAYWNIAVVSPICAGQEFLGKKEFPTLTRVFGPFTKMGSFFVKICEKFGWRHIGIIYNDRVTWTIPAEGIRYTAEDNGITVAKYLGFSDQDENSNGSQAAAQILREVTAVSRIIVISASGGAVRTFLIEAYKAGRTNGDFVFFCFEPYEQKDMFGDFNWKRGDMYDSMARKAYSALFRLSLYKPDTERYQNFSADVIRRSREDFGYVYAPDEKVSVLAALSHDSVWLYAQALNETLSENGNPYDGSAVTRKMWNRTITGIQGDVTIDQNGDRESAYMMHHIQSSNGDFEVIANYFGTNKTYEKVSGVEIRWPGGRKTAPLDTPECGFRGENCPYTERSFRIAMGLIVSVFACGALGIGLLYRQYKLQEKASMMSWKISHSEVTMVSEHRPSSSACKVSYFNEKSIDASWEAIGGGIEGELSSHRTAVYKENICSIRFLLVKSVNLNNELITELKQCRDLIHPNICCFLGGSLEPPQPFLLTEYCPKGSLQVLLAPHSSFKHHTQGASVAQATPRLQDILRNDSIKLDCIFKYSLMLDIVKGMDYLHRSPLRSHGHLSSSNCVVDSRFVLKVTDFGLGQLRQKVKGETWGCCDDWHRLLWTAPELLRKGVSPKGTQKGDVYSFGIIFQEIVYRRGPFFIPNCTLKPREVVERVKAGGCSPLRPHTDPAECPESVETLMRCCWRESPAERPEFSTLKVVVKRLCPSGGSGNILDDLLSRMEQYATNLEEIVSERTAQLVEEKRKAESLLTQMLPRPVAVQLITGKTARAETYDCVTIYFSDIEGFTAMSASITPMQVVNVLNDLYTFFDNIIDSHDVYKVETIGDAYMVVSGLPIRNGDDHAKEIARMSLAIVDAMTEFKSEHLPNQQLKVRIGLHSGPCVAGVVGLKMPRYCLFGDTVNTASRMESYGSPLRIHVSSSTKTLLDKFGTFRLELRGDIHMKGKGLVRTFWLLGEEP